MHDALFKLDARAISALVRSREVSPLEVLEATLERIEEINGSILAFCTVAADQARMQAKSLQSRLATGANVGALAGVPVGIKDLIFTKGLRTTGGSMTYREFVPDEDDIVVERLRSADAIILGKTNVSELGYSLTGDNPVFGVTRNPWDRSRSSGGSSAGAAAAVATGMGPIGIGGDGGGSIRVPAAFCGLFGFKGSMGAVPLYPGCRDERYPGFAGWESLEHIGPLTRTVADAALVMSVIAGSSPRDRYSFDHADRWLACLDDDVAGRRIGLIRQWGSARVDAEISSMVAAGARQMERQLDCRVEDVSLDWDVPVRDFRALIAMDSDLSAMRSLIDSGQRISPHIAALLGMTWSGPDFTDAIKVRKAVVNRMWRLMEQYDFLVLPATTDFAPPADPAEGASDIVRPLPTLTCVANMTGQPAASLPCGWSASGLPVGIQVLGRHHADHAVLALSAAFERIAPWAHRWPPI
jgi:aspartyl-tRNA(Asn)/glutamyl-tRNA(Gln) amidotransferase subunit A